MARELGIGIHIVSVKRSVSEALSMKEKTERMELRKMKRKSQEVRGSGSSREEEHCVLSVQTWKMRRCVGSRLCERELVTGDKFTQIIIIMITANIFGTTHLVKYFT